MPSLSKHKIIIHSTPDGNLRFFVEHWHGAQTSTTEPGTMEILKQEAGVPDVTVTNYPDGIINNKDIYNVAGGEHVGWGCVNDDTPDLVRTCNNKQMDWYVRM